MRNRNVVMMALVILVLALAASAGDKPEKVEVRHSMLGYRSTLAFYTFAAQRAILVLTIDNKDETFPVSGKIQLFDKATPEGGLKKWINNQHSDAHFIDAARPSSTHTLPPGIVTITARKQTGSSKNPGPQRGSYKDFELTLSIGTHELESGFKLPAFTDTAGVHVKNK